MPHAKIASAFELSPRVAVASEGSFGPHPQIPFVPLAREIVVMKDRVSGLELIGHHAGMETNFSHAVVADVAGAVAFADRARFPGHGVIVIGCVDQQPAPGRALINDIGDWADLQRPIETVIATCGAAFIETDNARPSQPDADANQPVTLLMPTGECGLDIEGAYRKAGFKLLPSIFCDSAFSWRQMFWLLGRSSYK